MFTVLALCHHRLQRLCRPSYCFVCRHHCKRLAIAMCATRRVRDDYADNAGHMCTAGAAESQCEKISATTALRVLKQSTESKSTRRLFPGGVLPCCPHQNAPSSPVIAHCCPMHGTRSWEASASVPVQSSNAYWKGRTAPWKVLARPLVSVCQTKRRKRPAAIPRTPSSGLRNAISRAMARSAAISGGACA